MRYFHPKVIFSITAALLFGHSLAGLAQSPFTISFDGPPAQPPGTDYNQTYYYESRLAFTPKTDTPGDAFGRCGGGISHFPEDGSAYLQVGTSLIFSFTNGLPFSLVSVDLAGYSDTLPDLDITFVGHKSDGATVTNSFSGSGINFQTYNFGPEFANVTNVEVLGDLWSMDNLVVQPAPPVLSLSMIGWLDFIPPDSYVTMPTPLLTFTTISNQAYSIEFSPDLSPGSWTALPGLDDNGDPASNIIGDGGDIQLVDTNAVTVPQRYYRIRVLP